MTPHVHYTSVKINLNICIIPALTIENCLACVAWYRAKVYMQTSGLKAWCSIFL